MLTPHEISLAERDPALPGLRVLLDVHAVRELLETRTGESLDGLRRLYIRYKPGMNLLVGYGRRGITEFHAKTFRASDRVKLGKVREKSVQYGNRDRRIVIDHPAMVVAPFPSDAKLPALLRIFSDRGRRHMARLAGVDHRHMTIRSLRYKPERRFVGQIMDDQRPVASFKTYTMRGLHRMQESLTAFGDDSTVPTARVLATAPRLRTVLFEWIDGLSVHGQILDGSWSEDTIRAVGQALARLHSLDRGGLPVWSRSRTADHVEDACATLGRLMPERAAQLAQIQRRVAGRLSDVSGRPVLLHGDFNAEQLIGVEQSVVMLDFDRSHVGPAEIDLCTFVSHLELDAAAGRVRGDEIGAIVESLADGFVSAGCSAGDGVFSSTPIVLIQLALTPFRRGETDWPEQVERILDRCDQLLMRSTATSYGGRKSKVRPASPTDDHLSEATEAALLSRSLDRGLMNELLDRMAADGSPGCAVPEVHSARIVKRRPGKRFVIEYSGPDGRDGLIGKVRVRGLDRRSFEVTKSLYDAGFRSGGDEPFAVPQPISAVPELHMSLQRRVAESVPWPWIEAADAPTSAQKIGQALARLHAVEPLTLRSHTISDELTILTDGLSRFAPSRPYQVERVQRILKSCRTMVSRLPVHVVRGIHRDFHPENVIVADREIYFIDFDAYSLGDPAIDVGNFLGHISEWSLRRCGHERALDRVAEAFLNGYMAGHGPADFDRIHAFTVLTLARLIYLSTERVGRSHTTERLIEACERRLGSPITAA